MRRGTGFAGDSLGFHRSSGHQGGLRTGPSSPAPIAAREKPAFRLERWATTIARAAAALVLGHVPLALAGLGAVVAVVPVTQLLLSHISRVPASPHPAAEVAPAATHRPMPAPRTPSSSILVVPSLAPLPAPFEPAEPAPAPIPSVAQPVSSRPLVTAPAEFSGDDLALSVERELLDQARRALVRGDPVGALASLSEHGTHYPNSQLAEEREALTIQALLRAGRVGDARFRAEGFRRHFPSSLLLPALDAALHE